MLKAISIRIIIAFFLLLCAAIPISADMKVKTKMTSGGYTSYYSQYYKGQRHRYDSEAITQQGKTPQVTIYQPDLKRVLTINVKSKLYIAMPLTNVVTSSTTEKSLPPAKRLEQGMKGGIATYTTTVTDLNEQKQMLGFTVRHLKISRRLELPANCNSQKNVYEELRKGYAAQCQSDTDGWYIYIKLEFDTSPGALDPTMLGCVDEIRYKYVGAEHLGYPLLSTTTASSGSAAITIEVVELSMAKLDDSLFDVPADYKETKDVVELYRGPNENRNKEAIDVIEAKRPGTVWVGIALINDKTNQSVSIESLRDTLIIHFAKLDIDAIPLNSSESSDVKADAKRKECDYILYTDLADLKRLVTSKDGATKESFVARLDFHLLTVGNISPELTSSVTFKGVGAKEIITSMALEQEAKIVATSIKKRKL